MISIREIRGALGKEREKFFRDYDPETDRRGDEYGTEVLIDLPDDYSNQYANYIQSNESEIPDHTEPEEIFEIPPLADEDKVKEILSGESGDEIRKSIKLEGVDALAWYMPFHVLGYQWGIYIPISSLYYLATNVFSDLQTEFDVKLKLAYRVLHQHELFHFAVEYMCSQWETITGEPFYLPSRELKDKEHGYLLWEEELANASMYRSMKHCSKHLKITGRADALKAFILMQPEGYKGALASVSTGDFEHLCREMSLYYIEKVRGRWSKFLDGVDVPLIFPRPPEIDWRQCPIIIVHDEDRFQLPYLELEHFRSIDSLIETEEFKKMLKKLDMKIVKRWENLKEKLSRIQYPFPKGLGFEKWNKKTARRKYGGNLYSVDVTDNFRAHLEWVNKQQQWYAVEIGTHTEMGHD